MCAVNPELLKHEGSLDSFSASDMDKKLLPDNIQQEGDSFGQEKKGDIKEQLEATAFIYKQLKETAKEPVNICITGSNGMYFLFNSLYGGGELPPILKQRFQKGKNDLDFGLSSQQARRGNQIWDLEDWVQNQDNHSGGHGYLLTEKGRYVVDFIQRPELRGLEWQEVEYNNEVLKVHSPEEMIFEKIRSLARPDTSGMALKWGFDTKLLKYYLRKSKGFASEEEMDEYLSKKWEVYLDSQEENSVLDLLSRKEPNETYTDFVSKVFDKPIELVKQEVLERNGYSSEDMEFLLQSETDSVFVQRYIDLARKNKSRMKYFDILRKAEENFNSKV